MCAFCESLTLCSHCSVERSEDRMGDDGDRLNVEYANLTAFTVKCHLGSRRTTCDGLCCTCIR